MNQNSDCGKLQNKQPNLLNSNGSSKEKNRSKWIDNYEREPTD